jgi:hypothetical protein
MPVKETAERVNYKLARLKKTQEKHSFKSISHELAMTLRLALKIFSASGSVS